MTVICYSALDVKSGGNMEDLNLNNQSGNKNGITLRDVTAIAFRHRRLISLTFLSILSGAILIAVLQPNHYEAALKIFVKKDRADPVVTSETNPAASVPGELITEEELNSEVVLLKSKDLLEKIVLACNLQHRTRSDLGMLAEILPAGRANDTRREVSTAPPLHGLIHPTADGSISAMSRYEYRPVAEITASSRPQSDGGPMLATLPIQPRARTPEENVGIAVAVQALEKNLNVEVLKKTNLIAATYQSSDPQLAAQVLATLANLYIEKHVAVHRPAGAFDFFQREAQKYADQLSEAEGRLVAFNRQAKVVSAPLEKEITLQKLADFQVSLYQTNAAITETQRRIRMLQETVVSIPTRMVTQVRNSDDGMLISQLKANLLTFEQKRIELLGKFEPSYRPVQEVDAQIAEARAALAEKSQIHDETSDRDPTYEWTREELAKANADLAGLQARDQATALAVRSYQENARSLDSKEVVQADLMRTIKTAEENYLLSLRKGEEARMSDALDRGRILNVAIAEPATVPALPSNRRLRIVFLGALLAVFMSAVLAFASERVDSTFRTPNEIESILNIPVLAAMPENGKGGTPSYA